MEPNGWYQKYIVQKTDGSPIDPKAVYFVLRLDTDFAARNAAAEYARGVLYSNPQLAQDIITKIVQLIKENARDNLLLSKP